MKHSLDQSLIDLYEDEYLRYADLAKQFAFALTLSQKKAFEVTKAAYARVVSNMSQQHTSSQKKQAVLKAVLHESKNLSQSTATDAEPSLVQVFKKLDLEQRAVTYLVDVVGFLVEEVARIFLQKSESDVRAIIAACRENTIQNLT